RDSRARVRPCEDTPSGRDHGLRPRRRSPPRSGGRLSKLSAETDRAGGVDRCRRRINVRTACGSGRLISRRKIIFHSSFDMEIQLMPQPYDEGDGPAIILLHGYPFKRSMWREQIDFLSAHGFRAIAPDLIETSDKLQLVADSIEHETLRQRQADAYRTIRTMESMARDVSVLMDDLKIDQAVICGL